MAECSFYVGATILIGIDGAGANVGDLESATCSAVLVAAVESGDGYVEPPSGAATVATFTAAAREPTWDVGPGWDLTIPATTSASIAAGTYVTRAVITLTSGYVIQTAPLFISLI